MIIKDARELYYFYSGKTSDLVRQLGLAGIAVVWLFKLQVNDVPKIPQGLVLPLLLIIIALALDLLQYAIASCIWGNFQWRKERAGTTEVAEFKAPTWFNWPGIICFLGKIVATIVAYFYLFNFLIFTILID